MKKTIITTFLVLALVLSSGINASAFAGSDIKVHTRASVASAFDTQELNNIAQNIYNFVPSSTNWLNASRVYSKINILPSAVSNYSHYVLTLYNGNLKLLCFNGDSFTIFVNTGSLSYKDTLYPANDRSLGNGYINIPVVNGGYSYTLYECAWADSSQWSGQGYTSASSDHYYSLYFGGSIISTNIPMYFYEELNMNSIQHTGITAGNLYTSPDLYNQLTDFAKVNLPYEDGDGNIVDPTPQIESNSNHMYFKDCEIGFCYPKTSPAPVSFGGAYFYIKYTVDDWIVNHISDYNLVFYAEAEIGNEVTNTTRYEIPLDPDGCITIPFSRLWISSLSSKGFSVLVTDREIEDNFYKAYLYSLSPAGFIDFGNKAAASNQNSISGALSALASGGIQSFLYYINGNQIDFYSAMSEIATSIATKYNPYLITAFTLLDDGSDNSGLFEMEFDLVAGTEDVTDTGGLVNPDPFVPEDEPDFTPPAPSPGNSTTPGYNIVPSGFWQGTMNAVIGYDPGYRDLKSDIDRDPDGNFSQYLDPMHNDDVGSWFMSFVNEMPSEMKSILIAGVGVGVLFGLYRFIRRG